MCSLGCQPASPYWKAWELPEELVSWRDRELPYPLWPLPLETRDIYPPPHSGLGRQEGSELGR